MESGLDPNVSRSDQWLRNPGPCLGSPYIDWEGRLTSRAARTVSWGLSIIPKECWESEVSRDGIIKEDTALPSPQDESEIGNPKGCLFGKSKGKMV